MKENLFKNNKDKWIVSYPEDDNISYDFYNKKCFLL